MTSLDWTVLAMYLAVSIVSTLRVLIVGVLGMNHNGNPKVEMMLFVVGTPAAIYLLVRHPWMCLLWFVVGSIVSYLFHKIKSVA